MWVRATWIKGTTLKIRDLITITIKDHKHFFNVFLFLTEIIIFYFWSLSILSRDFTEKYNRDHHDVEVKEILLRTLKSLTWSRASRSWALDCNAQHRLIGDLGSHISPVWHSRCKMRSWVRRWRLTLTNSEISLEVITGVLLYFHLSAYTTARFFASFSNFSLVCKIVEIFIVGEWGKMKCSAASHKSPHEDHPCLCVRSYNTLGGVCSVWTANLVSVSVSNRRSFHNLSP